MAIDCPFSWFRRPHSYRDSVDPSVGENARAGETLSDTDDDDDDDDDNGDAAVNYNDDSDAASMSASLSADPEVPSVTPPDAPVLRCDALEDADDPNVLSETNDNSEEPEVAASEQVDVDSASAINVSPLAGVLPFRRKRPRPDRDASGGQDFDVDLFEPT